MSDAERTPRIVAPVVPDDGSGYYAQAGCVLCGGGLSGRAVIWYWVYGDPRDLRRCVHALCAHDLSKLVTIATDEGKPVTPCP